MNTSQSRKEEKDLFTVARGTEDLADLYARIAPRFRRAEVRRRGLRYLDGLLSSVERKNGWQLAEVLGESGPQGVQRLLNRADWDEEGVRDDLRAYVGEQLGEEDGVLVVDETGFVKKGTKSVGVARQYSGTAGSTANAQVGVFLLYTSRKGFAFIDRALYLPEEWTQDRVRCREAGVPDRVSFATKGALAQQMLQRAFEALVPATWVVGDTVYGFDEMRGWLEAERRNYVLAVPETHLVWIAGQAQPVGLLAALLPEDAWVTLSAGEGSQGSRLYDWAWLQLSTPPGGVQGRTSWLLVRRSLSDRSDRAYYRASGPAQTLLPELVSVAGRRWTIEEGLEQAKGEVGLDQYEVRTWKAWYRFMTLALLAQAFLMVMRARAQAEEKKGEVTTPRSS